MKSPIARQQMSSAVIDDGPPIHSGNNNSVYRGYLDGRRVVLKDQYIKTTPDVGMSDREVEEVRKEAESLRKKIMREVLALE
jgi:hypothetical protein